MALLNEQWVWFRHAYYYLHPSLIALAFAMECGPTCQLTGATIRSVRVERSVRLLLLTIGCGLNYHNDQADNENSQRNYDSPRH